MNGVEITGGVVMVGCAESNAKFVMQSRSLYATKTRKVVGMCVANLVSNARIWHSQRRSLLIC